MATELTPFQIAEQKIGELQEALVSKNPRMPYILRETHQFLKEQPEVVTIFKTKPEMCATLMAALQNQTQTAIIAKAKKVTAASVRKASASDLGF